MKYFYNTAFRYANWPSALIAIAIFILSVGFNVFTDNSNNSNILLFLNGINGPGILSLSIIFIVVLPASLSIYEDLSDKNLKNILLRMNLKRYFLTKTLSVGIFTATLVTIMLTMFLIISLFYKSMPDQLINNFTFGAFKSLYVNHKIIYALIFIMNGFIFSFIFSIIGMVATIFWRNKYAAVLISFLLYLFSEPLFGLFGLNRFGFVYLFAYFNNYLSTPSEMGLEYLILLIIAISMGYWKMKRLIYNDK